MRVCEGLRFFTTGNSLIPHLLAAAETDRPEYSVSYSQHLRTNYRRPGLCLLVVDHNLIVLGQCKRPEECEFYLRMAIRERWSKRMIDETHAV